MANVTITELPQAGAITGTEAVPIVQNGQTVQTTTAALAGSPVQTQTFLTLNQEPTLANSRSLSAGTGVGLVDGGAQSTLQITLNAASGSLESASTGLIAKTASNAVTARSIVVSGSGLGISDGNGVSGNPTLALTGLPSSLAGLSGSGFLCLPNNGTVSSATLTGTSGQITVTGGDGTSGNPTFAIATDPALPGNGAMTIPSGTTAQQPVGTNGQFRFNSDTQTFDGYTAGSWRNFSLSGGVTSFSAGTTGFTPSTTTSGSITLGGTLNVSNGGTGAITLTGYVKGSGTSAFTASSTIPTSDLSGTISNAQLANSAVTFNGTTVSLGSSGTITATATNALTIGTGLSGTSYNGSSPVTIAIDSTVATLTGTQTLTNKSISGSTNTLTNVPNSALTNSSLTIGSTSVSLGGTATTLAGLTSITLTQDPTSDLQVATKQYVDSIASGLNYHQPVNYASTTTLPAYTYNNGASGVGATITATANGALSFGGGSPSVTQRLLVKDEVSTNAPYNGIYTVTQTGSLLLPFILTRATDYDTSGSGTNEIDAGDYVLVLSGTNASTAWVQQTPLPITVGTTNIVFLQFNAPITYTAGTGLNLSPATTFNISTTGVAAATYGSASSVPTIAVNAQGQITSASSTSIAINGNQITSGTIGSSYISGSYTGITGVGTLTAGTWNATSVGVGYGGTGLTSGTSGGTLYFSAAGALASSAALAINNLVIGGGAGGAPSTTTTGTGVLTALGTNVGTAGAFVVNGGALGTPSSGTVTNLTGTASININGTVGATTANTGAFTTVTATTGIFGGTF